MNLGLENKVILITGGTGGIGAQIVSDFLEEQAIVVCLIRNQSKMGALLNKLKEKGVSTAKIHSYTCDLLNFDEIKSVVNTIHSKFETIDILVNCAGIVFESPLALLDQKTDRHDA